MVGEKRFGIITLGNLLSYRPLESEKHPLGLPQHRDGAALSSLLSNGWVGSLQNCTN